VRAILINVPAESQEYIRFEKKWDYIEDEYLGINIVEAIFDQCGFEVTNLNSNNLSVLVQQCMVLNPEIIGLSIMQTAAINALSLVKKLRESGYKNTIIIGGWFVKNAWREIYQHKWPIDTIFYADAEDHLAEWLDDFKQGTSKKYNGILNTKDERIEEPINSQWPSNYILPTRKANRSVYRIETSRGCPNSCCAFCSLACKESSKRIWKPISWDLVMSEIERLSKEYNVKKFSFTDDELLGPRQGALQRAKELRDELKRRNLNINFSASIAVNTATNDVLNYLQDAGLEQLGLGFESADEKQLRRYRKPQTLRQNFEVAELIRLKNIKLIPGLITFDPFADRQAVRNNLSFLYHDLNHFDLSKLTKRLHLVTGTPIVEDVRKAGLLKQDYLNYDYAFQYDDTLSLYQEFEAYTQMISPYQLMAKENKDLILQEDLNQLQKKVAFLILDQGTWRECVEAFINRKRRLV
jgi:radical SAM superfamily enzyme YgiQ (UPF0313 family)